MSPRNRNSAVLAIGLSGDDERTLRMIAGALGWELSTEATLAGGLQHIISGTFPVIVCESRLPDGGWKQLLSRTADLPHRPRVIVSSRNADDAMWAEVLNFGGYDVLATPFETGEALRALCHAVVFPRWVEISTEKTGSRPRV